MFEKSLKKLSYISSLCRALTGWFAVLCVIAIGVVVSFKTIPTMSAWTSGLLFPSSIAAEAGPKTDEAYSDFNWDEIPLGTDEEKNDAERVETPQTEEAPRSHEPGTAVTSETEVAPAGEDVNSMQITPDVVPEQAEGSQASTPDTSADKADEKELIFDLDWSEGFEVEETEVGADQRSRRRAARQAKMARLANKPRVSSTAEPDFEGNILEGYQLFEGMRPYIVIPSKKDPDMHPCLDCHDWAESDLTPRILKEPHDNFKLQHGLHGKGEFWCLTCHHLEGDGGLKTFEGVKLSFDEAYILCSQCHSQEAKDWSFGAHGKRMDNWRGERRILNCTACHYQHRPKYDPRKPMPAPPLRMGLVRPDHPSQGGITAPHRHKTVKVWELHSKSHEEGE